MFLVSSCPPLSRKPHTVAGILDAVIPYQIPVRINGKMRSIHTQEEKQLTDFSQSMVQAYIEKKDGMICIAFTMPRLNPNAERIKVGIIRETHDAALLDSTAQELVLEIAENTNAHDQTVFRRAMLVMTLSVLLILLLCLLYTRRIAGYVADPIELERLRSRQEKEALEEANRMKTAFLSDVSHELKTPLAAMSGYAQNASMELTGNSDMDSVQEMLQRISSEANRIDMTGNHKKPDRETIRHSMIGV